MNGGLLSAVLGVFCPQSPIREFRATSVGAKGILHKICYESPLHHMATKFGIFTCFFSLLFHSTIYSYSGCHYRILIALVIFNVGT